MNKHVHILTRDLSKFADYICMDFFEKPLKKVDSFEKKHNIENMDIISMNATDKTIDLLNDLSLEIEIPIKTLKKVFSDKFGIIFPRTLVLGEKYQNKIHGYRYVVSSKNGILALFNIDKGEWSSLKADHPIVIEGWPE